MEHTHPHFVEVGILDVQKMVSLTTELLYLGEEVVVWGFQIRWGGCWKSSNPHFCMAAIATVWLVNCGLEPCPGERALLLSTSTGESYWFYPLAVSKFRVQGSCNHMTLFQVVYQQHSLCNPENRGLACRPHRFGLLGSQRLWVFPLFLLLFHPWLEVVGPIVINACELLLESASKMARLSLNMF